MNFCFSFHFCALKFQINLCIFEIGLHSWENISRQYVLHPWEDEILFPLCLMLTWFSNSFKVFIHWLFKLCALIDFWYRVFFCIKERTIDPILSWKVQILAGNILPVRHTDFLHVVWIIPFRYGATAHYARLFQCSCLCAWICFEWFVVFLRCNVSAFRNVFSTIFPTITHWT